MTIETKNRFILKVHAFTIEHKCIIVKIDMMTTTLLKAMNVKKRPEDIAFHSSHPQDSAQHALEIEKAQQEYSPEYDLVKDVKDISIRMIISCNKKIKNIILPLMHKPEFDEFYELQSYRILDDGFAVDFEKVRG